MDISKEMIAFVKKLIKEYDASEIYDNHVIFFGVELNQVNHPDIKHRFYDEVTITPADGGYKIMLLQTTGEEPIDIFIGD